MTLPQATPSIALHLDAKAPRSRCLRRLTSRLLQPDSDAHFIHPGSTMVSSTVDVTVTLVKK